MIDQGEPVGDKAVTGSAPQLPREPVQTSPETSSLPGAPAPSHGLPAANRGTTPPEPEYPAAPLASRRADPKPPPRYIDPEVFAVFHSIARECTACGYWRASAHHLISRAQGGDDVMDNLLGLCGACHGALHDGNTYHAYGVRHTPESVRFRIGAFLTSEAGADHLAYVKAKLGTGAAAFLSRYGVELPQKESHE